MKKKTHKIVSDTKQSLQSDRELLNIQYLSSIKQRDSKVDEVHIKETVQDLIHFIS